MCFLTQILIQSVCETVVPKLVAEDIPLLHSLLSDVFPGVKYGTADVGQLKAEIAKVCVEMHLVSGDAESGGSPWLDKVSCLSLFVCYARIFSLICNVVFMYSEVYIYI